MIGHHVSPYGVDDEPEPAEIRSAIALSGTPSKKRQSNTAAALKTASAMPVTVKTRKMLAIDMPGFALKPRAPAPGPLDAVRHRAGFPPPPKRPGPQVNPSPLLQIQEQARPKNDVRKTS